ncbi:class I SAM-dependent methyltransferase [Gaiella sp.]|uniref:O-methyltransferase n=1 Tax=Gaiella sp. TaxID=2663207 RepID=UPI003262E534
MTRALELAAAHGFEKSCEREDGALLHVLAARRGVVRAAEIGTGAGVGTAWIVSALPPTTPFFTVERDPTLAAATAAFYADDPNVTVLAGSWRETLPPEAPFDLLFVDVNDAKDDVEATVGLLAPGGTAVLDDFSFDPVLPDARRDAWLRHPLLTTIELWVTPNRRALVAVRR